MTWQGPKLSFQDCAAQSVSLADLAAGTDGLIVGIGAGWCEPCQEDAPLLEAFHTAHPELGLATILVEDADGAPVTRLFCEEWVEEFGLTYPVLVDPLVTTSEYIGDGGLPVHVAWAPDGTEVYRASGTFVAADVLAALGR